MSSGTILYIDEDPDEIDYFQQFMDGHFDLQIIQVQNDSDLEDLVDDILNSPPDAVITDFMLNEKATVGFNGQALIDLIQERNKHIPCFLLTSHAPDAVHAAHDARIVQSKAVMMGEDDDLAVLFRAQIAKIIEGHKIKLHEAESELEYLSSLPRDQINAQQRQRALELDTYIEEHGLGAHKLPDELKEDRSIELLAMLVNQVDQLLKKS